MPGPKRGYTTPHRCAAVDSSRRNQPSNRDRQARQRLQEKTSDFQVTFDDCVYLSLGPETKRDIYNMFDPDKIYMSCHRGLRMTQWQLRTFDASGEEAGWLYSKLHDNNFLNQEGSGGARALMTRTG